MAESGSQLNCLYLINFQKMKPVVNDDSRLHCILAQSFLRLVEKLVNLSFRPTVGMTDSHHFFAARETWARNFSMRSAASLRASAYNLGEGVPLRSASKITASAATYS